MIGRLLYRLRAGAHRSPLSALATPPTLTVSSPSFTGGSPIPRVHAGKGVGDDVSPELRWSDVPAGAAQLVLVMDDTDVPFPRPLIHTIAIVDPGLTIVDEGALVPGTTGLRILPGTLRQIGYTGPRPIPDTAPTTTGFWCSPSISRCPTRLRTPKGCSSRWPDTSWRPEH